MNGEAGWETELPPPLHHLHHRRIPTGVSLSHRYNIAPQQKTKGLMTLNCFGAILNQMSVV